MVLASSRVELARVVQTGQTEWFGGWLGAGCPGAVGVLRTTFPELVGSL